MENEPPVRKLMDESMPWNERLSAVSWLVGWAAGEAAVIGILYFVLRPKKPSVLTLTPGYLEYETGTQTFDILSAFDRRQPRKGLAALFRGLGNKTYQIKITELKSLNLERTGERQKLCFEYAGRRIEIGDSLSEPEREWLYQVLETHR